MHTTFDFEQPEVVCELKKVATPDVDLDARNYVN